jgi:hypothetical protein
MEILGLFFPAVQPSFFINVYASSWKYHRLRLENMFSDENTCFPAKGHDFRQANIYLMIPFPRSRSNFLEST